MNRDEKVDIAVKISNCYLNPLKDKHIIECPKNIDSTSSPCSLETLDDRQYDLFMTFFNHIDEIILFVNNELKQREHIKAINKSISTLEASLDLQKRISLIQKETLQHLNHIDSSLLPTVKTLVDFSSPVVYLVKELRKGLGHLTYLSEGINSLINFYQSKLLMISAWVAFFVVAFLVLVCQINPLITVTIIASIAVAFQLGALSIEWALKAMLSSLLFFWIFTRSKRQRLNNSNVEYSIITSCDNILSELMTVTKSNLSLLKDG